ncbi:MAG: hypothetical protein F3741_05555 [Nitrospinae bacterium]|nr:hypothetical protein [Nitrospinota bacterium]
MKSKLDNELKKVDNRDPENILERAEEFEQNLQEENMSLYRKFKLQKLITEETMNNSNESQNL